MLSSDSMIHLRLNIIEWKIQFNRKHGHQRIVENTSFASFLESRQPAVRFMTNVIDTRQLTHISRHCLFSLLTADDAEGTRGGAGKEIRVGDRRLPLVTSLHPLRRPSPSCSVAFTFKSLLLNTF